MSLVMKIGFGLSGNTFDQIKNWQKKKKFKQINQPCSFIKIVIYLFIYLLGYYWFW